MSQKEPQLHDLENRNDPRVPEPPQRGLPFDYNDKTTSKLMGIGHITIGIACVLCGGLLIGLTGYSKVSAIGHGFWGGMLFITVGTFQLLLTKSNVSKSLIMTTMVMSIVTASVIPFLMIVCMRDVYTVRSLVAHISFYELSPDQRERYNTYDEICPKSDEISRSLEELVLCMDKLKKKSDIRLALGITMTILAFIEVLLCMITSAICCSAVCCRRSVTVFCRDGNQVINYPNKSDFHTIVLQGDQEPDKRKAP